LLASPIYTPDKLHFRELREIPRPLDLAFRKDADPGIAEVKDVKKRLGELKSN
jgi:hypothetical protein